LFLVVIIIAILVGYILRGSLENIDPSKTKSIYLVFIAFLIEAVIVMSIRKGYLVRGNVTYIINLIMYMTLFIFIYQNRYNKWILLMGAGFLLNAVVIFFNGGAMPVSSIAVNHLGMIKSISSEGLYVVIDANTKASLLADIIPIKYPRPYVISIGDIVEIVAIAAFIITEMKSKKYKSNLIA
jgi:hypothetical protein